MTHKPMFYHAGCAIRVAAADKISEIVDRSRYDLEIVHLGDAPNRLSEVETAGVASAPAAVVGGAAGHITHGPDSSALQ